MKKNFILAAMLSVSTLSFQELQAMDSIKQIEKKSIQEMLKSLKGYVADEEYLKKTFLDSEMYFNDEMSFFKGLKHLKKKILQDPKELETNEDRLNLDQIIEFTSLFFDQLKSNGIKEKGEILDFFQKNKESCKLLVLFQKNAELFEISLGNAYQNLVNAKESKQKFKNLKMKELKKKEEKFKFNDKFWGHVFDLMNQESHPKENFPLLYQENFEKIVQQWIDLTPKDGQIVVNWLTQKHMRQYGVKNMLSLLKQKQEKIDQSEPTKVYHQLLFRHELGFLFPLDKDLEELFNFLAPSRKIKWEKFKLGETAGIEVSRDSSLSFEARREEFLSQFNIADEHDLQILVEYYAPSLLLDPSSETEIDEVNKALNEIKLPILGENNIQNERVKPLDVLFILCKKSAIKRFSALNNGLETFINQYLKPHSRPGITLSMIDAQEWETHSKKINPWMVFFFGDLRAHHETVQKIQQDLLDPNKHEHLSYMSFNNYLHPFKNKQLFHVEPYIDRSIEKQLKPKWVLFHNISTKNREKTASQFFENLMKITKPIWGESGLLEQILEKDDIFPKDSLTLLEEGQYNMRGYIDILEKKIIEPEKGIEPPFGHIGWNAKKRFVLSYNLMPIIGYGDGIVDKLRSIIADNINLKNNIDLYDACYWYQKNPLTVSSSKTKIIREEKKIVG